MWCVETVQRDLDSVCVLGFGSGCRILHTLCHQWVHFAIGVAFDFKVQIVVYFWGPFSCPKFIVSKLCYAEEQICTTIRFLSCGYAISFFKSLVAGERHHPVRKVARHGPEVQTCPKCSWPEAIPPIRLLHIYLMHQLVLHLPWASCCFYLCRLGWRLSGSPWQLLSLFYHRRSNSKMLF